MMIDIDQYLYDKECSSGWCYIYSYISIIYDVFNKIIYYVDDRDKCNGRL